MSRALLSSVPCRHSFKASQPKLKTRMIKKTPKTSLEWSSQVFPSASQDGTDSFVLYFLICLRFPNKRSSSSYKLRTMGNSVLSLGEYFLPPQGHPAPAASDTSLTQAKYFIKNPLFCPSSLGVPLRGLCPWPLAKCCRLCCDITFLQGQNQPLLPTDVTPCKPQLSRRDSVNPGTAPGCWQCCPDQGSHS